MSRREQRSEVFTDLGVVLERLWKFHQAMRSGRPIESAEENMEQLRMALRRRSQGSLFASDFSSPAGTVVSRSVRTADSRTA